MPCYLCLAPTGPGEYEVPLSPQGPAYTIAGKWAAKEAGKDSPGPGEYADGMDALGNKGEHPYWLVCHVACSPILGSRQEAVT